MQNARSGGETSALAQEPNQPHAASVAGIFARLSGPRAAHLHGKAQNLRHQQCQQHQQIPIADKERFHSA